jgi:hypothetical protein
MKAYLAVINQTVGSHTVQGFRERFNSIIELIADPLGNTTLEKRNRQVGILNNGICVGNNLM